MTAGRRRTGAAWDGLAQARREAADRGDRRVGTQHLLLALLARPEGDAQRVLRQAGASRARCETVLDALHGSGAPRSRRDADEVGAGDRASAVLDHAARTGEGVVTDEALLAALLADPHLGLAAAVFRYLGIGPRPIH